MPAKGMRKAFILARMPFSSARRHRHLLREFVLRDVRGRFAGSVAGVFWTLIHPLATIGIYFYVFSLILRVRVDVEETGTDRFAVFFLSGFFPWLLFTEGLSRSVGSLIDNANLITKVVFPVELIPAATVVAAFLVNILGMLLFLVYLLLAGYGHSAWLLLLILIPIQLVFTWGLASFLAALCVFVRDVREVLGIGLMVWFFATPVIYPLSMVPPGLRSLMDLNPMATFVGLYRDALLLHQVHWAPLLQAGLVAMITYLAGAWFFMRAKPAFGDVL